MATCFSNCEEGMAEEAKYSKHILDVIHVETPFGVTHPGPGVGRDVTHLTEVRRFFVPSASVRSAATGFLIISRPPEPRLKRSDMRGAILGRRLQ